MCLSRGALSNGAYSNISCLLERVKEDDEAVISHLQAPALHYASGSTSGTGMPRRAWVAVPNRYLARPPRSCAAIAAAGELG
jgi:hypothetical protein